MSSLRDAILKGFQAADKIHRAYDLRNKLASGKGYIDVFELIKNENIFLCFRKLDKLFGAYLPLGKDGEGILINSEHPFALQRFTAAHELGHYVMKHMPSLDTSMLGRTPIFEDNSNPNNDQSQEREADSFASALLMPRWLIIYHLKNMGLNFGDLNKPENIYKLSVRLGVSYSSMCWALLTYKIFDYKNAKKFSELAPKEIKNKIISEEFLKFNSWANVWNITQESSGISILGDTNELFVFEFEEHASSGYVWDVSELKKYGFEILEDTLIVPDEEIYGGSSKRKIVVTNNNHLSQSIHLKELRPWNNEAINNIDLFFHLVGRERGFYPKVNISQVA